MPEPVNFERVVYCIQTELRFARQKFPGNKLMLAALVEEVGELSKALIDHSRGKDTASHVFEEAVQVAAMAIRLAQEGDSEFPYESSYECYKDFPTNRK